MDANAYLCFTPDHDEDDATRRFVAKFGQPPELVFDAGGYLKLGPVPGQEATNGNPESTGIGNVGGAAAN